MSLPSEQQATRALEGAERVCRNAELRFTAKRRAILAVLVGAGVPLSAYELAERYQQVHGEAIAVMTVYRVLDAFAALDLVHKLRSTNQFAPCRHMACDHAHPPAQFLICSGCGLVRELDFPGAALDQLASAAGNQGFQLDVQHLELHGICDRCSG